MTGYDFHPAARLDLDDIWEFIREDDLDAADRLIADILSALRVLVPFPDSLWSVNTWSPTHQMKSPVGCGDDADAATLAQGQQFSQAESSGDHYLLHPSPSTAPPYRNRSTNNFRSMRVIGFSCTNWRACKENEPVVMKIPESARAFNKAP